MTVSSAPGFTEIAYQDSSGGLRYYKSDYPEYADSGIYTVTRSITDWPSPYYVPPRPLTHDLEYYLRGELPVVELPRCEYCGRKQAKKDEPLCPGCGNVV